MGDDFACREISVEAAHASCAECAPHRATDLGGDAAAHSLGVGQQNTFIDLVIAIVNEELVHSVGAGAVGGDGEGGDDVAFGELVAEGFGEVFEVVEFAGGFFVNPLGELAPTKGFFSELNGDLFKFGGGFANERFPVSHGGSLPGWGGFDLGWLDYCGSRKFRFELFMNIFAVDEFFEIDPCIAFAQNVAYGSCPRKGTRIAI